MNEIVMEETVATPQPNGHILTHPVQETKEGLISAITEIQETLNSYLTDLTSLTSLQPALSNKRNFWEIENDLNKGYAATLDLPKIVKELKKKTKALRRFLPSK